MAKSRLSQELKRYGYEFSLKRSLGLYGLAVVVTIFLGHLFRLGRGYLCALTLWVLMILPFFVRNNYKNRFEEERFSDVNVYIEQFLYSFLKSANIVTTLLDVRKLFRDGPMAKSIDKALEYIQESYQDVEAERNGLLLIEQEYDADLVRTVHNFAIQVEKNGGSFKQSVMLLLESRRMWANRTYDLMKEKKHQRMNILMSILTSLILCSMMYFLVGDMDYALSDNGASQIVTLFVLMLDFGIFFIADSKLSVDFMQHGEKADEEYLQMYNRIEKYDERFPIQRLGKKTAIKALGRQLEKDFPKWLMEVALLLQTENVQVAIFKSYDNAPVCMKPKLKEFIEEIKARPDAIEPYLNFLSEYTLPACSSSMKMLYSISEGAGGDAAEQIAEIIKQNEIMMDRAQKLKNEDALAGLYLLFLAPQITGGFKLMVDMLVLLSMYFSKMGGV